MQRKLPPLHALKVFEAAGRHLSFTTAAAELHLTQGAVSRQVRLLEEFVRKPLFIRLTRQVALTPEGVKLLGVAQGAFALIEQSIDGFHTAGQRRVISVSILPTLASLWLMPRLASFTQAYKGAEVRLITTIEAPTLTPGVMDIAIGCGALPGKRYDALQPRVDLQLTRDWTHVHAQELFPDRLVPVMSRTYASQLPVLQTPADLRRYRLIHVATRQHAWPDWLRAQGLPWKQSREDLAFGHFFMAMQAAKEGKGIAIVPSVLLANYEGRDHMVTPFPPSIDSAAGYYLLTRKETEEEPHIRRFRMWLMAQASDLSDRV